MIEVACTGADLLIAGDGSALYAEVELDNFVVGRTEPCAALGSLAKPRWNDRVPVMGTGRCLSLRVMDQASLLGEAQLDLQELLAQQPEGNVSRNLVQGDTCVGTLWISYRPVTSPTRSQSSSEAMRRDLQLLRQSSSQSQAGQANVGRYQRQACLILPCRLRGPRSPCGGYQQRVSSPGSPVQEPDRLSPLPTMPSAALPNAVGTPGTRFKSVSGAESIRNYSGISGASPASASGLAPRPSRSRSSLSAGSEKSPGSRLNVTEKTQIQLAELMRSTDKLRLYAERPFKARGQFPAGWLGFEDFRQALKELLQELHFSMPGDSQIQALFNKHRGVNEGVGVDEFEALLFRLLCFLRASEEVRVSPDAKRSSSEERDKNWRQEFIRKNPQRFDNVYDLKQQLGKGSFGTVYLVTHKTQVDRHNASRVRVCKIISKARAKEARTPESKVREEFAVLKQLDHPHVLRIFEDFEDEENFYLLMEQCQGGDLGEYVKCLEPMDAVTYEFWVAKVMQHTLSAVAYCHSKGVIHKDLKPENVMLSTPRHTPVQDMHVVVVDFGLSEVFAHPTARSETVSGTPPYMSPEVWQGNFSKSCDVWSVGCMLFFLLSGRLPFVASTLKEFPKAVQAEPDWQAMGGATPDAQDICRQMLQKLENTRPSAQECLKHKWFQDRGLAAGGNPVRALDSSQIQSLLAVGQRSEFEKFVTRFVATQMDASQQKSVNEAFRSFDTDGDGQLSAEELRQGLCHFGANAQQVEQVIRELDVGRTGQVSYTEFLAGIINLRGKQPEDQDRLLWIAWQQFRPDKFGTVKVQDIQNALATRGMTVAEMPEGFLAALNKEHTGFISFDAFKQLLLADTSGQIAQALTGDQGKENGRGAKMLRWIMQKVS